ncbi:MAG TPA: alpha/beta hydrolase [Phototrophicaceae bacterium]|nr:alpha/beta hydrolase [Phototrophicaceae bacterium]
MSQHQPTIEHTFIETNGVRLHVAQAGPADGPFVLLLHGFPDFWYGWHKQIPDLAQQGFRVIAPDQRGYNLSEKPAGIAAYQIDRLVADVIGLIDALGQTSVYLAGHDWGAAVAWETALLHPERVKKLAILNVPHPTIMLDTLRRSPRQMLKSWYIGFFQIPLLPDALLTLGDAQMTARALIGSSSPRTFGDADLAEYTRAWKQPGAMTAMLNWYRALVQMRPSPPADARVHVPTLVIWGAQDIALSREMAQKSVDLCDNGRLVMFEDASHWVHDEKPEQVNPLLADFFR